MKILHISKLRFFLFFLKNIKGCQLPHLHSQAVSKHISLYERGYFYKIRYWFWNSELVYIQGHPTTVFSEISDFSIA